MLLHTSSYTSLSSELSYRETRDDTAAARLQAKLPAANVRKGTDLSIGRLNKECIGYL